MISASGGCGKPVRFDDRLLTVLNQPASDRHDAAVRWRQLVDLVARAGPNSSSPVVAQALDSIRAESRNVDEPLRAAAARAVAALPLPLGLLECFAGDKLTVSAPVLAAASLDAGQWRTLLATADDETRRFVETLHPELTAAAEPDATEALVEQAPREKLERPSPRKPTERRPRPPAGPSLSEVVARIERRRRTREQKASAAGPAVPSGAPALFRWECGPSGEIAWIEGAPRGALIGRSIARSDNGARVADEVIRAFAMRAPFRDSALTVPGDGLVSGEWKISAVPAFDPADGRFRGYRGIALRDLPPPTERSAAPEMLADPDSLRELVHEIKTPLNAIIGFAEIIDGQYLGPADRRYRERASEIVSQAHLLLGAIDDLDFAAKIHSSDGARQLVNLGQLVERMTPSLREMAEARGVDLEPSRTMRDLSVPIEAELADRMIFRMCSAVIECAAEGERLKLSVDQALENCRVSITRPAILRAMSDEELFESQEPEVAQSFWLHLTRGLARIAGATLVASPDTIALTFPRA
ncbi:MAG TPA: histidine kinase dimerization/phospho-acceptor domain-containing protein [Sphingomicrobium sp.]